MINVLSSFDLKTNGNLDTFRHTFDTHRIGLRAIEMIVNKSAKSKLSAIYTHINANAQQGNITHR